MTEPPTIESLGAQVEDLKHHSVTILYLGAVNLIMNILTIGVAFLAVMPW